jgi:hypothetical protein
MDVFCGVSCCILLHFIFGFREGNMILEGFISLSYVLLTILLEG